MIKALEICKDGNLLINYNGSIKIINVASYRQKIGKILKEVSKAGKNITWRDIIVCLIEDKIYFTPGTLHDKSVIYTIACNHNEEETDELIEYDIKYGAVNEFTVLRCAKCNHLFFPLIQAINLGICAINAMFYFTDNDTYILTTGKISINGDKYLIKVDED
jgi:hypothetical protein